MNDNKRGDNYECTTIKEAVSIISIDRYHNTQTTIQYRVSKNYSNTHNAYNLPPLNVIIIK